MPKRIWERGLLYLSDDEKQRGIRALPRLILLLTLLLLLLRLALETLSLGSNDGLEVLTPSFIAIVLSFALSLAWLWLYPETARYAIAAAIVLFGGAPSMFFEKIPAPLVIVAILVIGLVTVYCVKGERYWRGGSDSQRALISLAFLGFTIAIVIELLSISSAGWHSIILYGVFALLLSGIWVGWICAVTLSFAALLSLVFPAIGIGGTLPMIYALPLVFLLLPPVIRWYFPQGWRGYAQGIRD
jgi:hypothetical protein